MTANELIDWIEEHGYSNATLAEALGVNRVTVAKWRSGARGIPVFLPLALQALARRRPPKRKPGDRRRDKTEPTYDGIVHGVTTRGRDR